MDINIFFTINDAYAKYLAVTMTSILHNASQQENIHFFVMDGGISADNKRRLDELKKIKNFTISYLIVDRDSFAALPSSSQAHISPETNYRFKMANLVPSLDKAFFLDADLIVEKSLLALWQTDMTDYYMACVKDQAASQPDVWARRLPLPEHYTYVNTGVILANLKKWREDDVEQKLFDSAARYANLLSFPDQDTLNIALCGAVKYLSARYNAMPVQYYHNSQDKKEAFSSPVIIHWAGCDKPWLPKPTPYADRFWQYARMTPFYEDILHANYPQPVLPKQETKDTRRAALTPLLFNYLRCALLYKITSGKLRMHYKQKRQDLRGRLAFYFQGE